MPSRRSHPVTAAADSSLDIPVWARPDAFPQAPENWGWVDAKGRRYPCESFDALVQAIQKDRSAQVNLVWTPDHERMRLPEEIPALYAPLGAARKQWVEDDLTESIGRARWFGGILVLSVAFAFYRGLALASEVSASSGTDLDFPTRLKFGLKSILASGNSGIALLMFVIFAFIPYYQARKRSRELRHWSPAGMAASVPTLRMETWLDLQKAPVTQILLLLIAAVAVVQLFPQSHENGGLFAIPLFRYWGGIAEAGLVKSAYFQGEWWRLMTAPLMHGNIVHLLMNASAMFYLGKRLEVFARWPHLVLVFVFAACAGGIASAHFVAAPSVGASGGLMGWLGFLLVFETLHQKLVPYRSRKRLAAGLLLTALIGLVGYRFIDNAAHIGGLFAGVLYAAIVFPRSSSGRRPGSPLADRILGLVVLVALLLSALTAILKILHR